MDVNPLDHTASKTRNRYRLLPVFLGIILLVQAGSAYVYHFQLDQSVSPQEIHLGDSVTMKFHVYDTQHGIGFAGAPVTISIFRTVPPAEIKIVTVTTNASGWATYSYTPQEIARFAFTSGSSVNYSTITGLPPVGMQSTPGNPPGVYFNVTSKPPIHVFTVEPVGPIVFVTTTTTTAPPVTTTQTAQQPTQVTQVTQATPAPQTSAALPASPTDTIPPVTLLTLAGTEDGSGGYRSDVISTMTASDNAGGSGVKVTQYSFDGISWYTYSQPVSVIKSGVTTLYYRSADNAGNMEVMQLKAIVISRSGDALAGTTAPGTGAADTPIAAPSTIPGTGSSMPLWLMALIVLIIIAAIGGGIYWKSRPKEEPKK
jgi:hypothetical protein